MLQYYFSKTNWRHGLHHNVIQHVYTWISYMHVAGMVSEAVLPMAVTCSLAMFKSKSRVQ